MNIIRDCNNWAVDDDFVYAVVKNNLLKINNENGEPLLGIDILIRINYF